MSSCLQSDRSWICIDKSGLSWSWIWYTMYLVNSIIDDQSVPARDVSGINFLILSVNLIPVPLSLTSLLMLLPHLLTLSIYDSHHHNSLSLSLPAQDLPLSQIFPTIDSLPASGLTPRLHDWSVSSEHLGFLFLFFFISLFCCGSMWQIKLAIC